MGLRFCGRAPAIAVLVAALLAAGSLLPAAAQSPKGRLIEPPANLPKPQKGDPTRNLDFLFEALKLAPDDSSAKAIEQRIWALWFVTRSDTANILMTRVKTAVEAKDLDLAIKLLDAIVKIRPDYAEAWNRRATLYYMKKDYGQALADIREGVAAYAGGDGVRRADAVRRLRQ